MARFALPIFEFHWRIIADSLIDLFRSGHRLTGQNSKALVMSGLATIHLKLREEIITELGERLGLFSSFKRRIRNPIDKGSWLMALNRV